MRAATYFQEFVSQHSMMIIDNEGGDLFPKDPEWGGFIIDVQSLNVLSVVYDALSEPNQAKFDSILQSEYKFANMLDKMWGWVKAS
jgi:hypothetical protein